MTSTPVSYSTETPATTPAEESTPGYTAPAADVPEHEAPVPSSEVPAESSPSGTPYSPIGNDEDETPAHPEQPSHDAEETEMPSYPAKPSDSPSHGGEEETDVPASPEAPASEAPADYPSAPVSAPAVSAPATTGNGVIPTAPATYGGAEPTAAPEAPAVHEENPMTTVTFSSSMVVPAHYTEGPSAGYEMANSSSTTTLVTTITVPKVAFVTQTITVDGKPTESVGLGAGSPPSASAYPTGVASDGVPAAEAPAAGVPAPSGSQGFGTQYVPKPTSADSPIEQVGNSGSKVASSFAGLALGAVAVVMAL